LYTPDVLHRLNHLYRLLPHHHHLLLIAHVALLAIFHLPLINSIFQQSSPLLFHITISLLSATLPGVRLCRKSTRLSCITTHGH
jgi:hypothetical protein